LRDYYEFVSINSCIQVELMGQICAESFGLRQFSAVGGQVNFVRGAQMSKGADRRVREKI
jgi:4-hydroxybutyrate CoA-transferase